MNDRLSPNSVFLGWESLGDEVISGSGSGTKFGFVSMQYIDMILNKQLRRHLFLNCHGFKMASLNITSL